MYLSIDMSNKYNSMMKLKNLVNGFRYTWICKWCRHLFHTEAEVRRHIKICPPAIKNLKKPSKPKSSLLRFCFNCGLYVHNIIL